MKEEKLVNIALEMFLYKGMKSVTMDEIAKEAGVSKKTLYEVFENKSNLVRMAIQKYMNELRDTFKSYADATQNAVDEVINGQKHFITQKRSLEQNSINELSKYYPEAYDEFLKFKNIELKKIIKDNIIRGQSEGHFREEISPDLLAEYRIISLFYLLQYLKTELDLDSYLRMNDEITKNYLLGMTTMKGFQYYDNMQLQ